jgi:acetate kinase
MKVLVLNCGSSSVKFKLFLAEEEKPLAGGLVERIGSEQAALAFQPAGGQKLRNVVSAGDHKQAIDLILGMLSHPDHGVVRNITEIEAVGHRVVHGGEEFTDSVLINEAVFIRIRDCIRFAPLHNPPNINGIAASLWLMPFAQQVAVFDTAFHQTLEPDAYIYALPRDWYQKYRIRRYGFHGTSHRFVAREAARILGKPLEELNLITCHLGNGSSLTAVKNGRSIDTSMGFTPLEGIVMGTRSGDIDPSIPLFIMEKEGVTSGEMDTLLNKKSGLAGITGGDNDLRTIEEKAENGSPDHQLALRILTRRIKKYIGAYSAVMGGLDGVVFTAGIGENSPTVRQQSCEGLDFLGIALDPEKNQAGETFIHAGRIPIMVIPTNEELAIAQEVKAILSRETVTVGKEGS